MSRWNQPVCDACWGGKYGGARQPVRLAEDQRTEEQCCNCGCLTSSGIWIRQDPRSVRFPRDGTTSEDV